MAALERLERLAKTGDLDAHAQLDSERFRRGRFEPIRIGIVCRRKGAEKGRVWTLKET